MAGGKLTKGVELGYRAAGTTGAYTKIGNMQEFPDLLGEPETVDVTTLEDSYRHYIPGIQDVGGNMGFTFLYAPDLFNEVNGVTGLQSFQLTIPSAPAYGASGSTGAINITWDGYMRPSIVGKGVNDALQFTLNVSPTSDFSIS